MLNLYSWRHSIEKYLAKTFVKSINYDINNGNNTTQYMIYYTLNHSKTWKNITPNRIHCLLALHILYCETLLASGYYELFQDVN